MALIDILGGLAQGFAPAFEQTTSDLLRRRIEADKEKQRRQQELDLLTERSRLEGESALASDTRRQQQALDLLAEKNRLEGESVLAGETRTLSPFLGQPKNVAGDFSITDLGRNQAIQKAREQGYGATIGPTGTTLTTQRKGGILDELYNAAQPVTPLPGVVEAGETRPATPTISPEGQARTVVAQMKQKGATFREIRMALQEMGYNFGDALILANKYLNITKEY